MNCRICQSKLALHAGGDLPPEEARMVEAHLTICPDCVAVLASYRQTLGMTRNIAASGDPMPSPGTFADDVIRAVADRKAVRAGTRKLTLHVVTFRYGLVALWVMAFAVFFHVVAGNMDRFRMVRLDARQKLVEMLVSRDRSLVSARTLSEYEVQGPWRLDEWAPSGEAGIYAILHKPDPGNRPDEFAVDYLGEAAAIEYRGDLWRRQRINRLTERTGSEDNIYIAEYPMPDRPVRERRAALNVLIDSLRPYYNN